MWYNVDGYSNKQPFLHIEWIILNSLFIEATKAERDANPSAFFLL